MTPVSRWERFVAACEQLGLHRDVVADEFTDQDRADLLDTYADDDPRLHRCAETLARDRRLIRATHELELYDTAQQPGRITHEQYELRARDAHLTGVDPELIVECDTCGHLTRSPVNWTGGVAGCAVRDDVPLQIPGRRMKCAQHTTTLVL